MLASAALILVAVPLLAAEFWDKKPFLEWSGNEVRRMLTRSPWAQQTTVGLDTASAGFGPPGGFEGPQAGGFPNAAPGGLPPDAAAGNAPQRGRLEPFGPGAPQIVVRWHSALPIRQALVRASVSGEPELTEPAQRFLEPQTEYYIVSVSGLPAAALQPPLDAALLAQAAALKRKGRSALRPEKAEIEAEASLLGLFFYFCRSDEITLADREVEFTVTLPELRFSRKFKLQDMVFGGKLEL